MMLNQFNKVLVLLLFIHFGAYAETISHGLKSPPYPWTGAEIKNNSSDFTFILHADLSGGERPEVFATAVKQISLLQPDFVISVGDLIAGGGDRTELIQQWQDYDTRAQSIGVPVFYVGGNHDVSSETERTVWSERYGPLYYHFRYRDVLFLVLDSEDMTAARRQQLVKLRTEAQQIYKAEGREAFAKTPYALSPERHSGAISQTQAQYFIDVIKANADVRHVFIFVHKPAWQAENTPFHQIEAALQTKPYTVFNGHVHTYAYQQRYGRDYIQLAVTGGEQFPDLGMSEDHITLVKVSAESDVSIATLMLDGIRDKTGAIPNHKP